MRRRLTAHVATYALGDIVSRGLTFAAIPIWTRTLPAAEFGALSVAYSLSSLALGLALLGGDTALSRFWFKAADDEGRSQVTSTWTAFLAVWTTVLSLAAAAAAWHLGGAVVGPGRTLLLVTALLTLPLTVTSRMLAQVLRSQFRPVAYAASNVALGLVGLVLSLCFVLLLDLGALGILLGLAVAELIVLCLRATLVKRFLRVPADRALLRRMLRFGVPLVPVSLSFWVFGGIDRLVLARISTLEAVAAYSLAASLTALVALITAASGQAWLPRLFEVVERDRAQAAALVTTSLTLGLTVFGTLAVTTGTFAPAAVSVIAPPEYAEAGRIFPLLAAGAAVGGMNVFAAAGLTVTGATGVLARLSLLAAGLNVAVVIPLTWQFGVLGTALATAFSSTALTLSYLRGSQQRWPVTLERGRLAGLSAVLLLASAALTVLTSAPLWQRAVVLLAFVAATALVHAAALRTALRSRR